MAPLVSQSTYSPAASSSSPASSSSSSSSPSSPKPNSSLYAAAILLLVASSSSIVSAQQCQNDPRFPECNSVNTDGVWRVPIPPTNSDWTRIFLSNQNSAYPIPSISPNPSSFLGSWRPGASLNGIPWGDPRSLNTELYACKQNAWAFTFDDGPSSFTPDLLDFLSSRSAKATFFVIGSSVINEAGGIETLRRAYREGHQIGYHTWTHRPSSTLTNDELVSEIVWTAVAIYRAIGRVPRYYRPPYGDIDDRVRNLLLAMGLRPVIWTVDPNDSGLTQNEDFVRNILNTFRQTIRDGLQSGTEWLPPGPPFPGFISLEHDIRSNQVEAARSAIPIVQEANFEMVQVVDCDTRDAGGAYLGNGEPLLELVRSIAPDVVEPIPRPSSTSITRAGPTSTTTTTNIPVTTITEESTITTSTPSPSTATTQQPIVLPPVTKSGLLSLPTPALVGIFTAITILSILIVVVVVYIARRKRSSPEFTKPLKNDSLLQPRDASGITLTSPSTSGAVLLEDTNDAPILLSHSHPLVNAAATLPRSVKSLGRAISIKSTRSMRSAALRDDPELGHSLIASTKSLPRSFSATAPDDDLVPEDTTPAPFMSLPRSISVREDERPGSSASLGRSVSRAAYVKAVEASKSLGRSTGRREPSLSRSVGMSLADTVPSLTRSVDMPSLARSSGEFVVDIGEETVVADVKVEDAVEVVVEVKDEEAKLIDI